MNKFVYQLFSPDFMSVVPSPLSPPFFHTFGFSLFFFYLCAFLTQSPHEIPCLSSSSLLLLLLASPSPPCLSLSTPHSFSSPSVPCFFVFFSPPLASVPCRCPRRRYCQLCLVTFAPRDFFGNSCTKKNGGYAP